MRKEGPDSLYLMPLLASRWMKSVSGGARKMMAWPHLPTRAVRPTLCTYSSAVTGGLYCTIQSMEDKSKPRAATSYSTTTKNKLVKRRGCIQVVEIEEEDDEKKTSIKSRGKQMVSVTCWLAVSLLFLGGIYTRQLGLHPRLNPPKT